MKDYWHGPAHQWFGLSYSSYLVLPRALIQGMPGDWQWRLVALLDEARETYDPDQIRDNYTVRLRGQKGRYAPDPLANYRRPGTLPYREKK